MLANSGRKRARWNSRQLLRLFQGRKGCVCLLHACIQILRDEFASDRYAISRIDHPLLSSKLDRVDHREVTNDVMSGEHEEARRSFVVVEIDHISVHSENRGSHLDCDSSVYLRVPSVCDNERQQDVSS